MCTVQSIGMGRLLPKGCVGGRGWILLFMLEYHVLCIVSQNECTVCFAFLNLNQLFKSTRR